MHDIAESIEDCPVRSPARPFLWAALGIMALLAANAGVLAFMVHGARTELAAVTTSVGQVSEQEAANAVAIERIDERTKAIAAALASVRQEIQKLEAGLRR